MIGKLFGWGEQAEPGDVQGDGESVVGDESVVVNPNTGECEVFLEPSLPPPGRPPASAQFQRQRPRSGGGLPSPSSGYGHQHTSRAGAARAPAAPPTTQFHQPSTSGGLLSLSGYGHQHQQRAAANNAEHAKESSRKQQRGYHYSFDQQQRSPTKEKKQTVLEDHNHQGHHRQAERERQQPPEKEEQKVKNKPVAPSAISPATPTRPSRKGIGTRAKARFASVMSFDSTVPRAGRGNDGGGGTGGLGAAKKATTTTSTSKKKVTRRKQAMADARQQVEDIRASTAARETRDLQCSSTLSSVAQEEEGVTSPSSAVGVPVVEDTEELEEKKFLAPTLVDWEQLPNGGIRGRVSDFGDANHEIGDILVTPPIVSKRARSNTFVAVKSGKRYFLSTRAPKKNKQKDGTGKKAPDNSIPRERVVSKKKGSRGDATAGVPVGSPTLVNWTANADGSVTGEVKFSCEKITTPPIIRGMIGHGHLIEASKGGTYFLA